MAEPTVPQGAAETPIPVEVTAPPKEAQLVRHNSDIFTTIKEGLAYILAPRDLPTSTNPKAAKDDEVQQTVFYNPIQQFNRDLSVLAIKAFGEDLIDLRRRRWEQSSKRQKHRRHQANGKRREEAERPEGVQHIEEDEKCLKRKRDEQSQSCTSQADTPSPKKPKLKDAAQGNPATHQDASAGEPSNKPTDQGFFQTTGDNKELDISEQIVNDGLLSFEKPVNGNKAEIKTPQVYRASFRILDALSATGLRALRYAQEIPFVTSVTANDMSPKAIQAITLNVQHNRLEKKIKPNTGNAMAHMYSLADDTPHAPKYDVIDLDPYGTAVPFLDAALHAVHDNGLLCVTCTDAGVFNSAGYLEKTYALYGGLPSRGFHGHETGLRLILHSIATAGARYGIAIEPLLSLSIDYYARVFVRIRKSPAEVKFLAGKQMIVYECDHGCGAWQTQYLARNQARQAKDGKMVYKYSSAQAPTASPMCEHCCSKTHLVGPMYGGPLHNPHFIQRVLSYLPDLDRNIYSTVDRIQGMLQTALEETLTDPSKHGSTDPSTETNEQRENKKNIIPRMDPTDIDPHPFFFIPSHIARILRCQAPPDAALRGALRHAGFRATRSHCKRGTIRTDAPWAAIWHIMREWIRQKAPIKEGALKEGMAGYRIMKKGHKAASPDASTDTHDDSKAGLKNVDAIIPDTNDGQELAPALDDQFRFKVVFDEILGRDHDIRQDGKRLVRYQQNPRADWGPMKKAK